MDNLGKDMPVHDLVDQPSSWVTRFVPLIPAGEVLDLASGAGRHSRLLAAKGYAVLAVDRSAESLALAAGPGITALQADLETGDGNANWPFEEERFSGIVVTNYLHRPLFARMIASLASNGILIYETFARGNEQFGKPSNPDFLLARGELLDIAQKHALQVIAFEDGFLPIPKPAMMQRICLLKADGSPPLQNLRLI